MLGFARTGRLSRLEALALSALVGLALVSTLTLAVGLAGGLGSRLPLLIALVLVVILSGWRITRPTSQILPPVLPTELPIKNNFDRWTSRLLPAASLGMACLLLLASLMPAWEFDVVEYHLAAPKEFAQAGSVSFVPHNVYANMPLGVEMHSLACMTLAGGKEAWWWGGLIGKLITGCFTLLAAALLGGFVARRFGSWFGWAAAGMWLSVPGIAMVTGAGLIDAALGAYMLAMAVVVDRLFAQGGNSVRAIEWSAQRLQGILLGSLLAGAAAACKYTGFVFAVVPWLGVCGWLVLFDLPATRRIAWTTRGMTAVALGLGLTCLPWLVKNTYHTGNPVYPLAASLLGGRDLDSDRIAQWQTAHRVPSPAETLSPYGWTAILQSGKQLWLSSTFLSPTLIPLAFCGAIIALLGWSNSPPTWRWSCLGLALWMLAVWWFATHRIDRFWLPIVPFYALFAAVALAWIARTASLTLASLLVLLSIGYGALNVLSGVVGDQRFLVSLAELRVDAGDAELPGRMSPTTLWINQHLDPSASKLLLIGEARAFDFEPPIIWSTCFDDNPAELLLAGRLAEERLRVLRQAGITHIMVHWPELQRYRSPGNYGFSPWPTPNDIEELVEQSVVERVEWPYSDQVDLLRVVQ
ncbi:MAG: hypothetical protein R3C53_26560 [Pirellulaceae bacterium]